MVMVAVSLESSLEIGQPTVLPVSAQPCLCVCCNLYYSLQACKTEYPWKSHTEYKVRYLVLIPIHLGEIPIHVLAQASSLIQAMLRRPSSYSKPSESHMVLRQQHPFFLGCSTQEVSGSLLAASQG